MDPQKPWHVCVGHARDKTTCMSNEENSFFNLNFFFQTQSSNLETLSHDTVNIKILRGKKWILITCTMHVANDPSNHICSLSISFSLNHLTLSLLSLAAAQSSLEVFSLSAQYYWLNIHLCFGPK